MRNNILHRRDRLIITTIEAIDELGLQGLSTREIAKREGVSEATLFRHYKSKNDLLLAVLNYYAKFDEDIFKTTQFKKLEPIESIYYLMGTVAEYFENYPEITAIMQALDSLIYDPELSDRVKEIVERRNQIIKELVETAQLQGQISKELDSESLSVLIAGFFRELCLRWRISNMDFPLKERTILTLNIILGGDQVV